MKIMPIVLCLPLALAMLRSVLLILRSFNFFVVAVGISPTFKIDLRGSQYKMRMCN